MESYDIYFVRDLSELSSDKDIIINSNILHSREENKQISICDKDREVVYHELVLAHKQAEESENNFLYKSAIKD